jgi:hypothetical protein
VLAVFEYFIFPIDKNNTDPTIGTFGINHWGDTRTFIDSNVDQYGQLFIQKYGLHIAYTRESERITMILRTNSSAVEEFQLNAKMFWVPLALLLYVLSYWCYSRRKRREQQENTLYYQIMKNLNFVNPQFLNKQTEEQKVTVIKGITDQLKQKINSKVLEIKAKEAEKALAEEEEDPLNRGFSFSLQK